jgi:hypothetical protein
MKHAPWARRAIARRKARESTAAPPERRAGRGFGSARPRHGAPTGAASAFGVGEARCAIARERAKEGRPRRWPAP